MPRWLHIFGIALLFPALADASDVVSFTVTNSASIEAPLVERAGDWREGRRIFFDKELTGCSVCHGTPDDQESKGRRGAPALFGVRNRLTDGEIRLWIVAPNVINPESKMPGYYLPGQRTELDAPVLNGPRLTAQQIEDMIAYLVRGKGSQ